MKAGNAHNPHSRLAQVASLERLRREAKEDPTIKALVATIVNDARLRCRWEDRDNTNVVALPKRRHGAGSRLSQLEGQIARATSPEERRQFELRRDQLEHGGGKSKKKVVAA